MAKKYNWRATTQYNSDTSLSYGVIPSSSSQWQDGDPTIAGSGTWQYWYRDANVSSGGVYSDANSSRVVVTVTQTWNTSIDRRNYLTVTVNTTIDSIVRDDLRGTNQNTPGRNITLYEDSGGPAVLSVTDSQLAVAHTIYQGPLTLQPETFVLAPGENATRTTLFLHNQTVGYPSYDDIWVGVQFRNPLPANYRPGATLLSSERYWPVTNGVWVSHNDVNGACHVLSNVNQLHWHECRTIGYPDGQGDPPLLLRADNDSSWYNMAELGKYVRP